MDQLDLDILECLKQNARMKASDISKQIENDVLVNYMIYAPEFGADIGNYHAEAKRWLCMAIPCTVTHWMPLPEAPEEGEKA